MPMLSVIVFLSLAFLATTTISGPEPNPTPADQFLSAHNTARSDVGVGPLTWSPKLASNAGQIVRAQRDQKECGFADMGSSPYGANQGWASYPASPVEVVDSWVGPKAYYNYTENACAPAHECGTYTQVVWRKSVGLGCAQAHCPKGETLTVCLYYPHGNVQGERPY
ncbi:STS14 protein [Acorus calamus]|uniref:STS14 protein n=1 Tax=Acorus calamus TaxID=4465 RepID=A0AAV9FCY7_ACOCL|nr:STS14 protein [Acorus calamus]